MPRKLSFSLLFILPPLLCFAGNGQEEVDYRLLQRVSAHDFSSLLLDTQRGLYYHKEKHSGQRSRKSARISTKDVDQGVLVERPFSPNPGGGGSMQATSSRKDKGGIGKFKKKSNRQSVPKVSLQPRRNPVRAVRKHHIFADLIKEMQGISNLKGTRLAGEAKAAH